MLRLNVYNMHKTITLNKDNNLVRLIITNPSTKYIKSKDNQTPSITMDLTKPLFVVALVRISERYTSTNGRLSYIGFFLNGDGSDLTRYLACSHQRRLIDTLEA